MGGWEKQDVQHRAVAALLTDAAERRDRCPTPRPTRPVEILRVFPLAGAGLTHRQERERGGSPGDGNASRAGVRRRSNRHLFPPHPDLGRRNRPCCSGSNLRCWINLVMYGVLGTQDRSSMFKRKLNIALL